MSDNQPSDWRAIPALCERLNQGAAAPTFTPHAMRHYVRHADHNGLAPAVRRIGRKILVSEAGFLAWLDKQTAKRRMA